MSVSNSNSNLNYNIKLYEVIDDNGKSILTVDFNKYTEILEKYTHIKNELNLAINAKDQKEELLREYENKMNNELTKDIEKIKSSKKDIEKSYDQLEEKYMLAKTELEKIKDILAKFKSILE